MGQADGVREGDGRRGRGTDPFLPYASGIAGGGVRVTYFHTIAYLADSLSLTSVRLRGLDRDRWSATCFNPRTGVFTATRELMPGPEGDVVLQGGFLTVNPSMEDWALILD